MESRCAVPYPEEDSDLLAAEHGVLLRHFGALQRRCTEQARAQAQEIARLQQQLVRVRAQAVVLCSVLAWEREDRRRQLAASADWLEPGLLPPTNTHAETDAEAERLARSQRYADLVICQTGCVSHGHFWRAEDFCRRKGATCVLAEQPDALRILRSQPTEQAQPAEPATVNDKDMP